jgi:hypothetical protein
VPDRRAILAGAGATCVSGVSMAATASCLLIRSIDSVRITERGATANGLRAAFREASGRPATVVEFEAAQIKIDSQDLADRGSILLPANCTIEGNGTSIAVLGSAITPPIFAARDVSRVAVRNMTVIGNNRAVADSRSGSAILFEHSLDCSTDIQDFRLENMHFSGFRGERWVQFLERNPHHIMSGIRIIDFHATGGSSLAPGAIGVSSAPLWFYGVEGVISDVEIKRAVIEAEKLKSGIVLFHKVTDAAIIDTAVYHAGQDGAADNCGAYAIMAYADRNEMKSISILGSIIRNPRSCGIYLRGADVVRVSNTTISGQTDTVSASLPKGAIAINGCTLVTIDGGNLNDNAFDLSVADGGRARLDLNVSDLTTRGSATSVILAVSPGAAPTSGVRFVNCDFSARSRVLRVFNDQVPGRWYNDVSILGGRMSSETAASVIELTQGGITGATGYRIEDVVIQANDVAIMASGIQGSIRIRRITIQGLGKLRYGLVADDCSNIDWDGITFQNLGSGFSYAARSLRRMAAGSIRNMSVVGGANRLAKGSLPTKS